MKTPSVIAISTAIMVLTVTSTPARAQSHPDIFVPKGEQSDLPRIDANDNRTPAGTLENGELVLDLEIVRADLRPETPDGPGLIVAALAEKGARPTVPGPLIRVETGTSIRVSVTNRLSGEAVTVYGLQSRPAARLDSIVVSPGSTETVEFEAGEPGTYLYRANTVSGFPGQEEREQLAGAFIVDPEGGSPADRVFVMNIFSTRVDTAFHPYGWLEALTVNGRSWPYTERQRPSVGDTLRWRVINASVRRHPMHLHGFYYDVTSIGSQLVDDVYAPQDRRTVVTEFMQPFSTMSMEWIPERPGNWLFHCHLSFHVWPEIRLPTHPPPHAGESPVHMAGLVLGIEVQPGPTDLIERGDPRYMTLHASEMVVDSLRTNAFSLDPDPEPGRRHDVVPGPMLVLRQFQPTHVTVRNDMSIPTGVHWHGLELDSWADGVPGWSASDGRVSPSIAPGDSFTYKLSLMRPGTFVYHSHLDDVHQLAGGLYGPLIVLAEGDSFDPETDHVYMVGWRSTNPSRFEDIELNGRHEQPDRHATVGESHRIRLINIAPAGNVTVQMLKGEAEVPLRAVAKDGADLPPHQQIEVTVSPRFGVGEAADFMFSPTEPGTYELVIGRPPQFAWRQKWIVSNE